MVLPDSQKRRNALIARDPVNTDAPGLQGNKNGPPGPAGNQKGPPRAPATTTEGLATSASQSLPSDTGVSSSATPPTPASSTPSPSTPAAPTTTSASEVSTYLTSSSVTITSIALTPSATPPTSASSTPSPSTPAALTTTSASEVSTYLTSSSITITSIALTPSIYYEMSSVPSTPSFVETTLRTTFVSISSATTLQTGPASFTANNTAQSGHSALGPGQKAGVAVCTIAGFAFILTLIFLFFKWCRGKHPKALLCLGRRPLGPGGNSRWLSRNQTHAEMSDTLLTVEAGSRGSLGWDYRATFARPTVTEKKRRSLPRSLRRLARFNPLGQNPISPDATGKGTPSRNSFAFFFRRRSTASSSPVDDPESPPSLPPLPSSFWLPRPPAISVQLRESVRGNTNNFFRPQTMPAQVLPPAFHHSWCYRNSRITSASEESEARSFRSVPGWVKFHYPHRSRGDKGVSRGSWDPLPATHAISPGAWWKAKILRRSHSTTTPENEKGHYMARDNGDDPGGTESPYSDPVGDTRTR